MTPATRSATTVRASAADVAVTVTGAASKAAVHCFRARARAWAWAAVLRSSAAFAARSTARSASSRLPSSDTQRARVQGGGRGAAGGGGQEGAGPRDTAAPWSVACRRPTAVARRPRTHPEHERAHLRPPGRAGLGPPYRLRRLCARAPRDQAGRMVSARAAGRGGGRRGALDDAAACTDRRRCGARARRLRRGFGARPMRPRRGRWPPRASHGDWRRVRRCAQRTAGRTSNEHGPVSARFPGGRREMRSWAAHACTYRDVVVSCVGTHASTLCAR